MAAVSVTLAFDRARYARTPAGFGEAENAPVNFASLTTEANYAVGLAADARWLLRRFDR